MLRARSRQLNAKPLGRIFALISCSVLISFSRPFVFQGANHMPWWRKRPVSSAPTVSSLAPTRVELIPGRLAVHIYPHDFSTQQGSLPCWTYLTEGLQRLNQSEVSVSL